MCAAENFAELVILSPLLKNRYLRVSSLSTVHNEIKKKKKQQKIFSSCSSVQFSLLFLVRIQHSAANFIISIRVFELHAFILQQKFEKNVPLACKRKKKDSKEKFEKEKKMFL